MDRNDVYQKVVETVAETMDADVNELTEETTFDSLSADSLDKIELVTALEDAFDASLDDDQLVDIQTIADAIDAIMAAE
ncbi:phosphopantetheine-binding protein [Olsenella sp. YH-ols2217]|uniref:Acyl carrier protein n=1 Tax=Kribbibacterium absianum TaxID=3044210 RepID=A0ABT6ZIW1_9ACTN|nr:MULTISPECIES: phosphopantetheine-binding protein [unclassified Olsenella]MDJ1121342.1 phosphopantetheine-binding protein [Olsenella sp. YH-ols2216]MDJ1128832.1 phosphopantetheine-binding protein [Olsenella sp. YH-ols2217]